MDRRGRRTASLAGRPRPDSVGDRGPTPANRKRNSTSHDKAGITVKARKIHAAGEIGLKGEGEMKATKAAEDLFMQYRIERAARWMGKFAILIIAMVLVAAVASLFTRKYL